MYVGYSTRIQFLSLYLLLQQLNTYLTIAGWQQVIWMLAVLARQTGGILTYFLTANHSSQSAIAGWQLPTGTAGFLSASQEPNQSNAAKIQSDNRSSQQSLRQGIGRGGEDSP